MPRVKLSEKIKSPLQTAQIGRPRAIQLVGIGEEVGRIVQESPHQTALNGRPGANEVGGVRIG